jgi:riboflavin kinase/FMN adenylyltransferase
LVAVRVLEFADAADARGAVATIGVFDGVHLGHQDIVTRVVERARRDSLAATVVTFHPHPAVVLDAARAPRQIETFERRLARLSELGVEQVSVVRFDERASLESAEDFVDRLLIGALGTRAVVVGEDFRFGHRRGGSVELLRSRGLAVDAVAPIGRDGRYSSTEARRLVRTGDLDGALGVLGHRVVLAGRVVRGDGRGAELGYPTANLELAEGMLRPGDGVYAAAARLSDGRWFAAATSIGRRPQFYVAGETLIEAHLVDFDGDLYERDLELVLLARLRGEQRFESVDELVAQIEVDTQNTVSLYGSLPEHGDSLLEFTSGQRR